MCARSYREPVTRGRGAPFPPTTPAVPALSPPTHSAAMVTVALPEARSRRLSSAFLPSPEGPGEAARGEGGRRAEERPG